MSDDRAKCFRTRAIYRKNCIKIANDIRDLMREHVTRDEDRRLRILSLKNSITDKLIKIKEVDETILNVLVSEENDEYEKEMIHTLDFHEQFYHLFVEIEMLTGSIGKSTGEFVLSISPGPSSDFPRVTL